MPRFDGTGPRRTGPLTGRGRGFCAVPIEGPSYRRPSFLPWRRGAGYSPSDSGAPAAAFVTRRRRFRRGGGRGGFLGGGFGRGRGFGRSW